MIKENSEDNEPYFEYAYDNTNWPTYEGSDQILNEHIINNTTG